MTQSIVGVSGLVRGLLRIGQGQTQHGIDTLRPALVPRSVHRSALLRCTQETPCGGRDARLRGATRKHGGVD